MPSYTINNQNAGSQQAMATTFKTLLTAGATTGATTLRRIWITELEWGATDVPAATDGPIMLDMSVYTTAGTMTALTPIKTDGGLGGPDAAALGTYQANASAEPTYNASSSVFFKSINQRASDKQWWRDKATCPISPAVTVNGWGIRAKCGTASYASFMGAQASVEE